MSTSPTLPSVPDVLADIATLLADPGAWTQGAFARTAAHRSCDPHDPDAVCWCWLGGAWKVLDKRGVPEAQQSWYVQQVRSWMHATCTTAPNPIWFNDHATHAEILAALAHTREIALASLQEEPTDEPTDESPDAG